MPTIKTNQGLVQTSQEEVTNLANQAGLQVPPVTPTETNVVGGTPDQAKMAGTPAQTQNALKLSVPVEAQQATVERRKEVAPISPSAEAQAKADRIMQLGSLNTRLEGLIEQYKAGQSQTVQDQGALAEAVTKGQSATLGTFSGWEQDPTLSQAAESILGPGWQNLTVADVEAKLRAEQANTLDEVAQIQRQLADPMLSPATKQALRDLLQGLSVGGTYAAEQKAETSVEAAADAEIDPAKQEWADIAASGDQELRAQLLNTNDDLLKTLVRMPPAAIKTARDTADQASPDVRQILGIGDADEFIVDPKMQEQVKKVAPVVSAMEEVGLKDVLVNPYIGEDIRNAIASGQLTAAELPKYAKEWDQPLHEIESVKRAFQAADIAVARPTEDNLNMLIKEVFGDAANSDSINAAYQTALDTLKYNPQSETAKKQVAQFKQLDKDGSGTLDAKDITGIASMIKSDTVPPLVDLLTGKADYTPSYNKDLTTLSSRAESGTEAQVSSLVKSLVADGKITPEELQQMSTQPGYDQLFSRLQQLDLGKLGVTESVNPAYLKSPAAFEGFLQDKANKEGYSYGSARLAAHGRWGQGTVAQILDFAKGPRVSTAYSDADLGHMTNVLNALRGEQKQAEAQGNISAKGQAAGIKSWADQLETAIANIRTSHQMAADQAARDRAAAEAAAAARGEAERAAAAARDQQEGYKMVQDDTGNWIRVPVATEGGI